MSQKPTPPRPGGSPPRPAAPSGPSGAVPPGLGASRAPARPSAKAPGPVASEAEAPSSSTQFFAIPPKKKGKAEAAPEPAKPEPPTAGRGLPSAPAARAPTPVAPPPPSGSPFAVAGPQPMGGISAEESRANSFQVFAIVAALLGLASMVVVVALIAIVLGWNYRNEATAEVIAAAGGAAEGAKDTGNDDPLVLRTREPRKTGGHKATVAETPAAPVEAPPAFADLTVTVPSGAKHPYVEVTDCGGERLRGDFKGNTVVVKKVPTDKECKLMFKGGEPAQFRPVKGGMNLSCSFVSTTAVCK